MEKECVDKKFSQISGIFSQFSEENKDKLLEVAMDLLKVQKREIVLTPVFQNENYKAKGCCPYKHD